MTLARHWRGLARPDAAAAYAAHLRDETFPALRRLEGFLGATLLQRTIDGGVECLVITEWVSAAAVARFAGTDLEAAVVPQAVQAMMIEFDERARHYELIETVAARP